MHQFLVEQAEMVTPSTLLLTLRAVDQSNGFVFQPGQYAAISFRRRGRPTAARCFSIASSPTDQDVVQFGLRVSGAYTRALSGIRLGSTVLLRGPYGSFIFDAPRQPEVVLCAGGIGITPMLSMLRFATQTQLKNKMSLVYCISSKADAPFIAELENIAKENTNVALHFVVSDGNSDGLPGNNHYAGRVSPDILRTASGGDIGGKTFFVCGPALFMRSVVTFLHELRVPDSAIITEAFSQGNGRQTSRTRGWPLNIYALGAFGTAAASIALITNDLIKTLPATLLPETLSSDTMPNASNGRQADLDTLINQLAGTAVNTAPMSPSVVAANRAVSDAEARVAEINAQNAANTGAPYVPAPTRTTASQSNVANPGSNAVAPPPKAPTPTPVCTTTASGITTCQ